MDPAYLTASWASAFPAARRRSFEMRQSACCCSSRKLAFLTRPTRPGTWTRCPSSRAAWRVHRSAATARLSSSRTTIRILEHVDVNRVHVLVKGRMTAEGDASMIADIDENGFEQFEQAALQQPNKGQPWLSNTR